MKLKNCPKCSGKIMLTPKNNWVCDNCSYREDAGPETSLHRQIERKKTSVITPLGEGGKQKEDSSIQKIHESTKVNVRSFTPFIFEGKALPLFGRALVLFITQCLIIPAPWAAAWYWRYYIKNTSSEANIPLSFHGRGGQVWFTVMLLAVIAYSHAVPLLPLILMPLTIYLSLRYWRWMFSGINLHSGDQLKFNGSYWGYFGWSLLSGILTLTVIGVGWGAALWTRWFFRNVSIGNRKLIFTGTAWAMLWRFVTVLLSAVLIIPIPWTLLWYVKWFTKKIAIQEEPEKLGIASEAEFVGTYEGTEDNETVTFGLLKGGRYELYESGKSAEEGRWKVINDKIHITINDSKVGMVVDINQINADGSLTEIAEMIDGKREDTPKEEQFTYTKIK